LSEGLEHLHGCPIITTLSLVGNRISSVDQLKPLVSSGVGVANKFVMVMGLGLNSQICVPDLYVGILSQRLIMGFDYCWLNACMVSVSLSIVTYKRSG